MADTRIVFCARVAGHICLVIYIFTKENAPSCVPGSEFSVAVLRLFRGPFAALGTRLLRAAACRRGQKSRSLKTAIMSARHALRSKVLLAALITIASESLRHREGWFMMIPPIFERNWLPQPVMNYVTCMLLVPLVHPQLLQLNPPETH